VLPVLPAVLAAGAAGGRRRPLGIAVGLTVTFTVTVVGIAKVVGGIGLGADPLRSVAVVVLLLAGLLLIVPRLGDPLEARLSRLSAVSHAGAALGGRAGGAGFASGLLVGAALGFVYTPCAGPILAAVISVGAATGRSVIVGLAYAVGSAVVLFVLILGGRTVFERVRRTGRGPTLQRVLGAVMVLTAVAIIVNLDVTFDQWVARHIPNVNLTAGLERSNSVAGRLSEITGHKNRYAASSGAPVAPRSASQAKLLAIARSLHSYGAAPNFVGTEDWFGTPADKPLSLSALRGRVVLIDFWTYTCINCIRTLPHLEAWEQTYRHSGLTIVGVETPEFPFEREASNVKEAIGRFGINYPVVQDNESDTWNAYQNEYWPADYLIDAKGQIRYVTFGEGDYERTETALRSLLAEAGYAVGGRSTEPRDAFEPSGEYDSGETYLGTNRAEGWISAPVNGRHDYGAGASHRAQLPLNHYAYSGTWEIGGQPARAVSNAGIEVEFDAKSVYLVMSSTGNLPRTISVWLDGRPIPAAEAGADVHGGTVSVHQERLYWLVHLPRGGPHRLKLAFSPGVVGYSFTYG
jgi:cytochrome c biogenesis protein CcdA/thiol-disulfide isomerase/thioredoxin